MRCGLSPVCFFSRVLYVESSVDPPPPPPPPIVFTIATCMLYSSCRRTPLHMSAGNPKHLESSWILIENGGQVMACDVLGVRPLDLYPVGFLTHFHGSSSLIK